MVAVRLVSRNLVHDDFRLFTVRDMHNTVWDMNDRNCVVLGPTAPLEYLVLQRVLVSYTESVSNIILDVHLITEIDRPVLHFGFCSDSQ